MNRIDSLLQHYAPIESGDNGGNTRQDGRSYISLLRIDGLDTLAKVPNTGGSKELSVMTDKNHDPAQFSRTGFAATDFRDSNTRDQAAGDIESTKMARSPNR